MRDLGTFRSTRMMEIQHAENCARQDMLWVLIAAGACIYAISYFATRDWALALNLPV